MRRLFYLAMGAAIGVAVVRKATKTAQRLTPAGLADAASASLGGVGATVRGFVDELRAAMAEREIELNEALTHDVRETGHR